MRHGYQFSAGKISKSPAEPNSAINLLRFEKCLGVGPKNLALDEYLVEVGINVPVPAEALKDLQRLETTGDRPRFRPITVKTGDRPQFRLDRPPSELKLLYIITKHIVTNHAFF